MTKNNSTQALIPAENTGRSLPLTRADSSAMREQRGVLIEFVNTQLREGIKADFAVIPGTGQKSLLKPGAEKLQKLFGLGCKIDRTENVLDREGNFALFSYKAQIVQLSTGRIIAECEGSANSQEKKYKERKSWVKKTVNRKEVSEQIIEPTPVCDVLNTLMKMAQKRAMVGATILAVGASDFFTQDVESLEDLVSVGGAVLNEPIKQDAKAGEYVLEFGRDKGKKLLELGDDQMNGLISWFEKLDSPPTGKAGEALAQLEVYIGKRIR